MSRKMEDNLMVKRWWALAGAAPVLALAVGLGVTHRSSATAQQSPMPMVGQDLSTLSGDAFDQAFLRQMIMHHAMAVMMAEPVVQGAVHPELAGVATAIITAQTNEIAEMRGWLQDWYGIDVPDPPAMMQGGMQPAPPSDDHSHGGPSDAAGTMPSQSMPTSGLATPMAGEMPDQHMAGQGMPGMRMDEMEAGMMQMMTQQLSSLQGSRLEAVFMSLMIPHRQQAIDMANLAPGRAAHQELMDLAGSIVTSQSAEIQQMNDWLSGWYGL